MVEALGPRPWQHQTVMWWVCGPSPGPSSWSGRGGTPGPKSLQGPGPAGQPLWAQPVTHSSPLPVGSHKFLRETGGHAAATQTRHPDNLSIPRCHVDSPFIWAAHQLSGAFWRSGEQTWQRGERESPQRRHGTVQAAVWRPVMLDTSYWVGAVGFALTIPRGVRSPRLVLSEGTAASCKIVLMPGTIPSTSCEQAGSIHPFHRGETEAHVTGLASGRAGTLPPSFMVTGFWL